MIDPLPRLDSKSSKNDYSFDFSKFQYKDPLISPDIQNNKQNVQISQVIRQNQNLKKFNNEYSFSHSRKTEIATRLSIDNTSMYEKINRMHTESPEAIKQQKEIALSAICQNEKATIVKSRRINTIHQIPKGRNDSIGSIKNQFLSPINIEKLQNVRLWKQLSNLKQEWKNSKELSMRKAIQSTKILKLMTNLAEQYSPTCIELLHDEDEWKILVNTIDLYLFCNDNELLDKIEKYTLKQQQIYPSSSSEPFGINLNQQFFTYREIVIILIDYITKNENIRQQYFQVIEQQKQKIEQENKKLFQQIQEQNIKFEVFQQEKNNELSKKTQELREKIKQLEFQNYNLQDQSEKLRKQMLEFHIKYDTLIEEKLYKGQEQKDSIAYQSIENKYQGQLKNYDELKENYNKIYDQYKECVIEIKQLQEKISLSENKIQIIQLQKTELEKKVQALENQLTSIKETTTPRPDLQELLDVAAVYDLENIGSSTKDKIEQVIKNFKIFREVNSKSKLTTLSQEQNVKVSKNSSSRQSPMTKNIRQQKKTNKYHAHKIMNNSSKATDNQAQKSNNQLSLTYVSNESHEYSLSNQEDEKPIKWELENETFSLLPESQNKGRQQIQFYYQNDQDALNKTAKNTQYSASNNQIETQQNLEQYNFVEPMRTTKSPNTNTNIQAKQQNKQSCEGMHQNTKEQFLKYIKITQFKYKN
ncbi:hypothetical protein TTHERM_00095440 (macronuclear) [Tetrahymena thermophila SB210]|uniref:Uncharacterized protein n=1 Tax=Tetrahymena thermophila (strain SB210) TaxID=312017 RepID=Q235A5_TETTS|nr:hypothetical protein TTHERM_00095440 [Tetrahymena thermophila SB210]EAR91848.2 hypothetical protein TTHERM_00095440 [Tetrahymena thermophila SB210]|eukprot:XP_001012093.2 hypothetical protein TTHERM_00095440 [Tetrahymena thermophila SB210]